MAKLHVKGVPGAEIIQNRRLEADEPQTPQPGRDSVAQSLGIEIVQAPIPDHAVEVEGGDGRDPAEQSDELAGVEDDNAVENQRGDFGQTGPAWVRDDVSGFTGLYDVGLDVQESHGADVRKMGDKVNHLIKDRLKGTVVGDDLAEGEPVKGKGDDAEHEGVPKGVKPFLEFSVSPVFHKDGNFSFASDLLVPPTGQ